ncbi:MAG TPA: hypothetical protein VN969_21785 [Streptosporangiaceae bacterium]|nr:hypothetical protein [Streptosporangiaceae bacterium]
MSRSWWDVYGDCGPDDDRDGCLTSLAGRWPVPWERSSPGTGPACPCCSAPWQAFGSVRSDAGDVRAVGRVSIAGGWDAITALEVAPAWRRRGLGVALL